MNTVQIRLYDLFRKELNLPDDKAASFVAAVEEVVGQKMESKKQTFASKDDIHVVRDDIHRLELKVEQAKSDVYKAMFVTGLVQLLGILGGVLAIVKFMMK